MQFDVIFIPGADPGFQVRGGGALKKIALSRGRREHFWSISCEKSRFYAKKSYFFQFWGGGGGAPDALPPGSAPAYNLMLTSNCMCRPYIDTNNPLSIYIGSTHAI